MVEPMEAGKRHTLVLGLGNTLLTDEQIGVRVAEAVGDDPRAEALGIRALDGGTMGFTLMGEMEDAGAMVVIDAAALGEAMHPQLAACVAPAVEAVFALVAGWDIQTPIYSKI